MLLFRPPLMRFGVAGVRPPDFAAEGDDPSPLDNDLPLLADRDSAEWLWVLLPPLLDGSSNGTTSVDDLGAYAHVGPDDGTWQQDYRGLVMPLSGAAQVYESTITLIVGASVDLAGNAAGGASAAGSLSQDVPLAGNAAGGASAAGSLSQDVPLSGGASGGASASGALYNDVQLAGNATGGSSAAGALSGTAVWPDPAVVLAGVTYGPTGLDYTGTLALLTADQVWSHGTRGLTELVDADVKKMNGATVTGDGTAGNKWRGA